MNELFSFLKKYLYPLLNIGLYQIINLITPFIILPLQIRNIVPEGLSKVFYFQAIFTFIGVFVAFGLNQNGTRLLAKINNRNDQLNLLFQVSLIKLLTYLFCILSISLIILLGEGFDHLILFLVCSWPIMLDILIPEWYYQGIKKTKIIFQKIATVKVILILGNIFLLPHFNKPIIVPVLNVLGILIVFVLSIRQEHIIQLKTNNSAVFDKQGITQNLKESFHFFSVNISSKIYLSSGKLVIGSFAPGNMIIIYEVLEKILNLLKVPNTIINQVFFVYSNEKNSSANKMYRRNLLFLGVFGNLILMATIFLLGEMIFNYLTNYKYPHQGIIYLISFIPIVIFVGQYYGLHSLVTQGFLKQFSRCINLGVILFVILMLIGIILKIISIHFIYSAMLLTEIIITFLIIRSNKKYVI